SKSETSANSIRKRLVYRGYWDAETKYSHDLDSAAKKAEVNYLITPKAPTYISESYYNIPDPNIKNIYEIDLNKSLIRSNEILDQTVLEQEVKRINTLMREKGYYEFNNSGQEIYFTADTLNSRKQVPLTMEIHKDSLDSPYKVATIGDVRVFVVDKIADTLSAKKDSLLGINFFKQDERYKTRTLWRPVILRKGEVYDQRNLDLTRRNFQAMNNFSIISYREGLRKQSDSIIDVSYYLAPLPKYDLKISGDINYSQLMSIAVSPSVDLTTRNLFGGAQNLNTSVSWITGLVQDTKDPGSRTWAHEFSANTALSFPKLLLPFNYYKLIPKRYSPTSSINLGVGFQKNIGLERINFNTGLSYQANVNDIVSHRLTLFNTQLSLTRNKDLYYEYFTKDQIFRDQAFQNYSPMLYQQFLNGQISSDELSSMIIKDEAYVNSLSGGELNNYNSFRQSLINKDRQTQDVLISSFIYNFIYN